MKQKLKMVLKLLLFLPDTPKGEYEEFSFGLSGNEELSNVISFH